MNTTGLVMTVTDELLAELEQQSVRDPGGAFPVRYAVISELTAELRRLRAENAELAQSLAESRANDQAAMGWLTSLRWASGDRGERMFPELVTHIEGLAKDASRLQFVIDEEITISKMNGTVTPMVYQCQWHDCRQTEWYSSLAEAIDTAMFDTAMAAQ